MGFLIGLGRAGSRAVKPRMGAGGGAVAGLLFAVALACLFAVPESAASQDVNGSQNYTHPGTRYTYEDPANAEPARWEDRIVAQFIGISDSQLQTKLLSQFLQFSEFSGYDATISGFPGDIFEQSKIDEGTNLLVLEVSEEAMDALSHGEINEETQEMIPESAENMMQGIFQSGLSSELEGCGIRWSASPENIIHAAVIVFSRSLTADEKAQCIEGGLPRAFGIFPFFTIYSMPLKIDGVPMEIRLSDRSELLLQLEAARACREQAKTFDNRCPFFVVNEVLKNHGQLAQ